nr:hypothetical protein [Clostridium sp. CF012]
MNTPFTPLLAANLTFSLVNDYVNPGPRAIKPFIGIALDMVTSIDAIAPPENPPISIQLLSIEYCCDTKL